MGRPVQQESRGSLELQALQDSTHMLQFPKGLLALT